MSVISISDTVFQHEVLDSKVPVLVDFWAAWCGPCRMVSPVLDEIATTLSEKVKVAKINVDENPETPTIYQVRSIPTLILFKNGQPVDTIVGAHPKSKLTDWLNEHLS
jgi:thioredoxin 1